MKITIIGWQPRTKSVVEEITHWPDEMDKFVAIARASRKADVVIVEEVLVETGEEKEDG